MASREVRSGKWKRKTVMEERAKTMNRAKHGRVSGEPIGETETGSGVGGESVESTAGREETGSGVGGAPTAGREETASGVGGAPTAGREEMASGVGGASTAGREETGSGVGGASTAGRGETESVFQGLSDIEDDSASSTDEESFDDEKAQPCMGNIKSALQIAEYNYPMESHTIVWLFDQSSCHRAFAEDALNVRRMNVRPGGAQPRLRNSVGEAGAVNGDGRWDAERDEDGLRGEGHQHRSYEC